MLMSDLKQHYQTLFAKHGSHHHAVQYSAKQSQFASFRILLQNLQLNDSILDIGCGLGDMLAFLRTEMNFIGHYKGLDFVPEFIQAAKQRFADDSHAEFEEFNLNTSALPEGYSLVVLAGVFNNLMDDNESFMNSTIKNMYKASNSKVAFNALSTYVDYQDESLYYYDPLKVFDFCKRELSSKVTLRHDYCVKENSIPFEFSIYLYKG